MQNVGLIVFAQTDIKIHHLLISGIELITIEDESHA